MSCTLVKPFSVPQYLRPSIPPICLECIPPYLLLCFAYHVRPSHASSLSRNSLLMHAASTVSLSPSLFHPSLQFDFSERQSAAPYYTFTHHGVDRQGRPCYYEHTGKMDLHGVSEKQHGPSRGE